MFVKPLRVSVACQERYREAGLVWFVHGESAGKLTHGYFWIDGKIKIAGTMFANQTLVMFPPLFILQ